MGKQTETGLAPKIMEITRHESVRGWFAYELYHQMVKNKDIWLITGDLGYGMFDFIKKDFSDRFVNT